MARWPTTPRPCPVRSWHGEQYVLNRRCPSPAIHASIVSGLRPMYMLSTTPVAEAFILHQRSARDRAFDRPAAGAIVAEDRMLA